MSTVVPTPLPAPLGALDDAALTVLPQYLEEVSYGDGHEIVAAGATATAACSSMPVRCASRRRRTTWTPT